MVFKDWLKIIFGFSKSKKKKKKELEPVVLTNQEEKIIEKQGFIIKEPETNPVMIMTEEYAKQTGTPKKDLKKIGYIGAIILNGWKVPMRILHKEVAKVYR